MSIAPYAASEVWVEAAFCSAIFILSAVNVFQRIRDGRKIFGSNLLLPLSLLAVYSALQGLATLLTLEKILPASSFLPYSYDLTASFWSSVKILAVVCFIDLLLDIFRENIRLLIWGLVATGNVFALLGILRYLLQRGFPETFKYFIFPQLVPSVGFGTFINQNHFAYLMLMTIGLGLGLFWWGKLSRRTAVLLLGGSLVSWMALVLTGSRGGIISSFTLIAFLIFFPAKSLRGNDPEGSSESKSSTAFISIKRLMIFASVCILLVLGVVFIGQDRVVTRFEKLPLQIEEESATLSFRRMDVYKAAIEVIEENPVFGAGFGGFRFAVSRHIDITGVEVPEQAHNDYLEYIASGGLIALVFAFWLIFNLISETGKNLSDRMNDFSFAARVGAICAIAGISVHNLFDFSLQMFANLLFAVALVVIAVRREGARAGEFALKSGSGSNKGKLLTFNFLIFFLFAGLLGYAIFFGFTRYGISRSNPGSPVDLPKLPFDAEGYQREAELDAEAGKNGEALEDLAEAIRFRPEDYALWLELGRLQERAGQTEKATESFRRSVELAPFYSTPRMLYGSLLVDNNEKAEGFEQLRQAFRNNPQNFYKVAEIAWKETGKDGRKTTELLSPLNVYEAAMLNIYFLQEKDYSSIVYVTCQHEDLPRGHRDVLVRKLLEKRQYYFAHQIYSNDCGESSQKAPAFESGDFESGEIKEGNGFGWRSDDLPDEIKLGVEKKTSPDGSNSLIVNFAGNSNPKRPIIKQFLIVEPNQKYEISFTYKSDGIVTGGIPVISLIPRNPDSDGPVTEISLSPEKGDWRRESAEIETDATTQAIEIRLARKSCGQKICPIFGRLQLADFKIREK
ncbi:MAG: O-antigen ligase family protein [Pyrinomonadaceae bacterium]